MSKQDPYAEFRTETSDPYAEFRSTADIPAAGAPKPIPKGMMQEPSPAIGSTELGALTTGVDPRIFIDRLLGATSAFTEGVLPGGDTRRPERTLAELTPQQEIGARTAAIGAAGQGASAGIRELAKKLPSESKAAEIFNRILGMAKDVPLNLSKADEVALEALQMGGRGAKTPGTGSTMPKVLSDYIRQREMSPQMTYETGRKFAVKSGSLSAAEKLATDPPMQRMVSQFANALKDANREAAVKVGAGKLYDAAMKEYRQAKNIADKTAILKKHLLKFAIGAGTIGVGAKVLSDWSK